jgi:hypothetical protein
MAGPIITKISNWLFPEKKPAPAPLPEPPPTVAPEPEPVQPSGIQAFNYVRALLILKNLPLKQLREEFLKLPLAKICWTAGLFIWAYMTYALASWLLWHLLLGF